MIKLLLGAGDDPGLKSEGWINIDLDPPKEFVTDEYKWYWGDLFDIIKNNKDWADHVESKWVFEHISFTREEELWTGCFNVLKPGGTFKVIVPDFENICRRWLEAENGFKGFFHKTTPDDPKYGFGHGLNLELDKRWGPLITWFYGVQVSSGQFHRTAYDDTRLIGIMKHVGFEDIKVEKYEERNMTQLVGTGRKPIR